MKTPADARAVLAFLRQNAGSNASSVATWSEAVSNAPGILYEIKTLRVLAGESGPDFLLTAIFFGDVTVAQPPPGFGPVKPVPTDYVSSVEYDNAWGRTRVVFADGSYKVFYGDGSLVDFNPFNVPTGGAPAGTYAAPPTAAQLGDVPGSGVRLLYLNSDLSWAWVGGLLAASALAAGGLVFRARRRARGHGGGINALASAPRALPAEIEVGIAAPTRLPLRTWQDRRLKFAELLDAAEGIEVTGSGAGATFGGQQLGADVSLEAEDATRAEETIRRIARRSGVNVSSILYGFKGKVL